MTRIEFNEEGYQSESVSTNDMEEGLFYWSPHPDLGGGLFVRRGKTLISFSTEGIHLSPYKPTKRNLLFLKCKNKVKITQTN